MAASFFLPPLLLPVFLFFFFVVVVVVFFPSPSLPHPLDDDDHNPNFFSIIDYDSDVYSQDYSPPSPPLPPPPPPHPPSVTCSTDLHGSGSLNSTCELNTDLHLQGDLYIEGDGNLVILPGVALSCPLPGCQVSVNISGQFSLGENASVVAGAFSLRAGNATFAVGSVLNTTALAGPPPAQTSGTPSGTDGAGGGHGGRGACCLNDHNKKPEDVWGGDAYSWSSLDLPWSYGSKGGTTSATDDFGGGGGGRVWLVTTDSGCVEVGGTMWADGGNAGLKGGGGSGGSIYIKAHKM